MENQIESKIRLLAGPIKRLISFSVDMIILNLLFLIIYLIYTLGIHVELEFWKVNFVIFILYFTICDSYLMKGISFGKLLLRIGIQNVSGKALNITLSFIRSFLSATLYFIIPMSSLFLPILKDIFGEIFSVSLLSGLFSFLFSGYTLFMTFHPFNLGIHDVLCKSLVVNTNYDCSNINYDDYNHSRMFVCYILSITLFFIIFILLLLFNLLF